MDTPEKELLKIASRVRKKFESLGIAPGGWCDFWNGALAVELEKQGWDDVHVITGTFETDFDMPIEHRDSGEIVATRVPEHTWLDVAGLLIVDISADQFNPYIQGKKMAPIIIDSPENLPRYIQGEDAWEGSPDECASFKEIKEGIDRLRKR
jgi:hypothetical protein